MLAGSASAAPRDDWSAQANQVCTIYVARAKKLFAKPVQPAGLYTFAEDVKTLETSEFNALNALPGRPAAGDHALVALRGDIGMVTSAIHAWDRGPQGVVREAARGLPELDEAQGRIRGRRVESRLS